MPCFFKKSKYLKILYKIDIEVVEIRYIYMNDISANICGYIGFIMLGLSPLSLIQQTYLTKSTSYRSYKHLLFILFGLTISMIYTAYNKNTPIIVGLLMGFTMVSTLIGQKLYYDRKREVMKTRLDNTYKPPQAFI